MLTRLPISVIILYHNGISYLKSCMESLLATVSEQDEIIVIVNNYDKAVHRITKKNKRVRYIHYYENMGHGKAANKGVENASNEFIVIADHDLVFQPGWLDELWIFYNRDSELGAVCCKIINTLNRRVLDFGIAYTNFNFTHPFMDLDAHHPLVSSNRIAQMTCTGGMLLQRKDFKSVAGFNESFGTLYTDLDLCLKLKIKGFKVGVAAGAVAYHFSGEHFNANRKYKASFLKSDIKGAFMKAHGQILETDMPAYYDMAYAHYHLLHGDFSKYFVCNMMNVADPEWYEAIFDKLGGKTYDKIYRPTGHRDDEHIRLFETLGYDVMKLGVPLLYLVDRFISVKNNAFWWQQRRLSARDLVIDRNGNIVHASELLGR